MKPLKIVSPFEFAITEIVDPEKAKTMRAETRAEQADRIENKIRETFSKIKGKKS